MDFQSKVDLRMQGYSGDQITALEIVWDAVPEPISLVVTEDNYVYYDGLPVNVHIHYGEHFASVDGAPCIILRPVSYGVYEPDEFYNLENLDAYRDELFAQTTARIRSQKFADAAAQIAAQSAPEPEPALPTMQECNDLHFDDYLYLRCGFGKPRLPLSVMMKCVCKNPDCPHSPNKKPKTWQEKREEQARDFHENQITRAMLLKLVDQAASTETEKS